MNYNIIPFSWVSASLKSSELALINLLYVLEWKLNEEYEGRKTAVEISVY